MNTPNICLSQLFLRFVSKRVVFIGLTSLLILSFSFSPLYASQPDQSSDSDELIIEEDAGEDELVIEEGRDKDELIIEEDAPSDGSVLEKGEESLVIEEDKPAPGEELVIDDSPEKTVEIADSAETGSSDLSVGVDEVWADYATIPDSNSRASGQLYVHAKATAHWRPSSSWEFQVSGRVDGYEQIGGADLDDVRLDYEESFVRYRNEAIRLTVGAQKVLWGRIDEIPPTDRLSTPDLTRYILDDLKDRRRANPAIRLEAHFSESKLDLVYLPIFRPAELPDIDSIWYPINSAAGEILGLAPTPATRALIQSSPIDNSAPDSDDGGFGARFSSQAGGVDFAITAQKVRQATPYYAYNASRGVIEAKYPRSWVLGGDFGFEALGATWRFEGAWSSDTPVTRIVGGYDTVESVAWGAGVELYPGDSDTRLTLQLAGVNLLSAPAVVDREEVYLLNGELEVPFAQNQWTAKARFYIGLDERDIYLNPRLSYTGWEDHEVYLEGHYFDGDAGTPGGFHQDKSLMAVGWRTKF